MSNIDTDKVIEKWAQKYDLFLRRDIACPGRYSFHKSNNFGECFQISIFPPVFNKITIEAWSIETKDDIDLHCRWDVATNDLRIGLDSALAKVNDWAFRSR